MNKGGSLFIAQMMQFAGEFFFFFQSIFNANEMFYLLNKFVIFTKQKSSHGNVSGKTVIRTCDHIPYILSDK